MIHRTEYKKQLDELQFHFLKAISNHSSNKNAVLGPLWKAVYDNQQERPYHNMFLAYRDLDVARKLGMSIPDSVIVAAVLRYYNFSPNIINNSKVSANYVNFFLDQPFGWRQSKIDEVVNLIKNGSALGGISDAASFPEKLFHDMKLSRLAKNGCDFEEDRRLLRQEFIHLSDKKFYKNEKTLLMSFHSLKESPFSLLLFRPLTEKLKENVSNRLKVLEKSITELQ